MYYEEDDMLMLSGIQHFAFCPRQWALIHIEQQWSENLLTIEGQIMHRHVDEPSYRQKMGNIVCLRAVSIASRELGLYGITDLVELHPAPKSSNTITHPRYPGHWLPYPVEYKHGRSKRDNTDAVQLCAQAMCLEEQYSIRISSGALFYGESKSREEVDFDDALRAEVRALSDQMHQVYASCKVPHAEKMPRCRKCSLLDVCMPPSAHNASASVYLKRNLYEETT